LQGWLVVAILVGAGAAAYANSFGGVLLYDDLRSIRDNHYIKQLWPLSSAMSLPFLGTGETVAGRPILSLTFALNHHLLGPDPWGFHLVNLVIHIAAGLTLFALLRDALRAGSFATRPLWRRLPLTASLIWLVHPLHTESVTYIVQRAESLAGLCYLLALYAAVRGLDHQRSPYWQGLSVLFCALGMGVKESLATAPLLILAYDRSFVSGSFRESLRRHRRLYAGLSGTWLVMALPLWGLLGFGGQNLPQSAGPLEYALTQPEVILHYLRLAVWPSPLVIHYNWPIAEGVGDVAAAVVASAWGFYRKHWVGFLGVCFFLFLAPTSSFIVLDQRIQEHRMYLPLAAVVVLLCAGGGRLYERATASMPQRAKQFTAVSIVGVTVALLAALTHARNEDYRDELVFWEDACRKRPQSAPAHTNAALALEQRGQFDRAAQHYELALAINPKSVEVLNNFAVLRQRQGHWNDAADLFLQCLKINPNFPQANFNLARVYERSGDLDRAVEHYTKAIEARRGFALAHNNLGVVYERRGDLALAQAEYERAIAIKPDYAEAHNNLGSLLFKRGALPESEAEFARALAINPELHVARRNLEIVRARLRSEVSRTE
jgi:Tfp pilus assembly protein PilF